MTNSKNKKETNSYDALGVSASKEGVHKAVSTLNKGIFPKAFCMIFPDFLSNNPESCLILHVDGAGTKSDLAMLDFLENLKKYPYTHIWKELVQNAIVMNLDDIFAVGVTDEVIGYASIINRNTLLFGDEQKENNDIILKGIIDGAREFFVKMGQFGVKIQPMGGETADVGDLVRTIIVDAAMVVSLPRKNVISFRAEPGDVVVGLSSSGKAIYEDSYTTGIGSNGLTLARHGVFSKYILTKYPDTINPALKRKNKAYYGKHKLLGRQKVKYQKEEIIMENAQMILSPTRTYAPILQRIYKQIDRAKIKGVVHCSGGGQTKVLNFLDPTVRVSKYNMFPVPQVFSLIQSSSKTSWKEMYQVFNMGHRMEIYCDSKTAKEIINISRVFEVDAQIIGKCYKRKQGDAPIVIKSPHGTFEYGIERK